MALGPATVIEDVVSGDLLSDSVRFLIDNRLEHSNLPTAGSYHKVDPLFRQQGGQIKRVFRYQRQGLNAG